MDVALQAGANAIAVWFGDLCERDTRYGFELTLLEGEGLGVALRLRHSAGRGRGDRGRCFRTCGSRSRRSARARWRSSSRSRRRATSRWGSASQAICPPPTRSDSRRKLKAGESAPRARDRRDAAGRLLPFHRHAGARWLCAVARRSASRFAIPRRLSRRRRRLRHGRARRWRTSRRTATPIRSPRWRCLRPAQTGADWTRRFAPTSPAIVDCHDCADFWLVPLLWCRAKFADAIGAATSRGDRRGRARLPLLDGRARQRRDVVFQREPRAALPHRLLSRRLAVSRRDVRALRTEGRRAGRTSAARACTNGSTASRRTNWRSGIPRRTFRSTSRASRRLSRSRPTPMSKARAERAIRRLLEIVALSSHQGMLTASQGRSYEHSLRPATTLELSSIARLFFGRGGFGSHVHALPLLALLVRDHGFAIDPRLTELALWREDDALEWTLPAGAGRNRRALSSQDARPCDGERHRLSRRASGAIRRRCCISGSASARKRRSGSIIRASGTSPAVRARPTGAAAARFRACTSIALWRWSSSS